MAPRYSKKKAKYTYTERVLGALSEIQKDHRKHAVHMATLRAQIRKTASARKDKMGPQWSQWVSRTVHKLADDGILDTTDSHGNVTFTPDAKKIITTVRRESLGPGVAAAPQDVEHKIWKDVTRRFSTVGVKRSRRRSSAVSEGEESRPKKRQARKSFSALTKPELEAELNAALERLRAAEEPEITDEAEIAELREELQNREQEVAELRDQVARLRDHPPLEQRIVVGTSSRLLTPPPTNPSEALTPSSSSAVPAPRLRVSATHGVTRTLSGSLISNLTKRPTPEPSDIGSHDGDDEDMVYERPLSPAYQDNEGDTGNLHQDVFGLETPHTSPVLGDQDGFEPETRDEAQMVSLRQELEVRILQVRQLEDEQKSWLAERDELRNAVASRDARLRVLETELRYRADSLASSESCRAELERSLQSERIHSQEVSAALEACQQDLDAERQSYATLDGKHANLREMVSSLQTKLAQATGRSDTLEIDLKGVRSQAAEWQSAHAASRNALEAANATIATLHNEVQDARRSLQNTEDALGEYQSSNAQLVTELASANSNIATLRQELSDSRAARESMEAQIRGDLRLAEDNVTVLTASKVTLERAVTEQKATVAELRTDLSRAKAQVTAASAQLQQSQDVINDLRMSHAQTEAIAAASTKEAAALKDSVSELELVRDTLRSQLDGTAAEVTEVRAQLETAEASRLRAESELVASKAERDTLLADIADKTAQLQTTTERFERVQQLWEDERRRAADLEAQREKEVAAHVTERSALESSLETVRAEVVDLRSQVDKLRSELKRRSDDLDSVSAERDGLLTTLRAEVARASALQEELSVALDDVRDAEEEIGELRQAKAEDEASIQSLKDLLTRLRRVQMDVMEEVDNKMVSAHTAPTPGHRRRSSIALRQSVGMHA